MAFAVVLPVFRFMMVTRFSKIITLLLSYSYSIIDYILLIAQNILWPKELLDSWISLKSEMCHRYCKATSSLLTSKSINFVNVLNAMALNRFLTVPMILHYKLMCTCILLSASRDVYFDKKNDMLLE